MPAKARNGCDIFANYLLASPKFTVIHKIGIMIPLNPLMKNQIYVGTFSWRYRFTNNIVYMSLSLTVTMLAGDRYLNFFIYWLAEIPAILFFFLAVNK